MNRVKISPDYCLICTASDQIIREIIKVSRGSDLIFESQNSQDYFQKGYSEIVNSFNDTYFEEFMQIKKDANQFSYFENPEYYLDTNFYKKGQANYKNISTIFSLVQTSIFMEYYNEYNTKLTKLILNMLKFDQKGWEAVSPYLNTNFSKNYKYLDTCEIYITETILELIQRIEKADQIEKDVIFILIRDKGLVKHLLNYLSKDYENKPIEAAITLKLFNIFILENQSSLLFETIGQAKN